MPNLHRFGVVVVVVHQPGGTTAQGEVAAAAVVTMLIEAITRTVAKVATVSLLWKSTLDCIAPNVQTQFWTFRIPCQGVGIIERFTVDYLSC